MMHPVRDGLSFSKVVLISSFFSLYVFNIISCQASNIANQKQVVTMVVTGVISCQATLQDFSLVHDFVGLDDRADVNSLVTTLPVSSWPETRQSGRLAEKHLLCCDCKASQMADRCSLKAALCSGSTQCKDRSLFDQRPTTVKKICCFLAKIKTEFVSRQQTDRTGHKILGFMHRSRYSIMHVITLLRWSHQKTKQKRKHKQCFVWRIDQMKKSDLQTLWAKGNI